MIIRHKHKGRFTVVPNAIFNDDRISLGAKGLLGYLLSRPGNWDVRHDQLQHQMGIGRKLLSKYLKELEKAGYLERDEEQGRDEHNRFTTLNYVVRDIPELTTADALVPLRLEPQRDKDTGNNKEEIKTDSNNPKLILTILSPNPFPPCKLNQSRLAKIGLVTLGNGLRQLATTRCTSARSPIKPGSLFAGRMGCPDTSIARS